MSVPPSSVQRFSNSRVGVEKTAETSYTWTAQEIADISSLSGSDLVDQVYFLEIPDSAHPSTIEGDAYLSNPLRFYPVRVEWFAKVTNTYELLDIPTVNQEGAQVNVMDIVPQQVHREFNSKALQYFMEFPYLDAQSSKWQVMTYNDSRVLIPTDGKEYQIANFPFNDNPIIYSLPNDGGASEISNWMVCTGLISHQLFNPSGDMQSGGVSLRCKLTYIDMNADQQHIQSYTLPSVSYYETLQTGKDPRGFFGALRGVVKVVKTIAHVVTGAVDFADHVLGKSSDPPPPSADHCITAKMLNSSMPAVPKCKVVSGGASVVKRKMNPKKKKKMQSHQMKDVRKKTSGNRK